MFGRMWGCVCVCGLGGVESPSTWIFGTGSCYSAEYFSRKDTGMERALRSHWFIQSLINHTCTYCRLHLRIGLKSRIHGHILVESLIGVIQNYMNCEVYVLGRFTYMYMLIYIYGHQMVHMYWGRMHLWGGPFRCLDLRQNGKMIMDKYWGQIYISHKSKHIGNP